MTQVYDVRFSHVGTCLFSISTTVHTEKSHTPWPHQEPPPAGMPHVHTATGIRIRTPLLKHASFRQTLTDSGPLHSRIPAPQCAKKPCDVDSMSPHREPLWFTETKSLVQKELLSEGPGLKSRCSDH